MSSTPPSAEQIWSTLRRFVRPRPPVERCALCGALIAPEHAHLVEPSKRQLLCSCDACAILFSGQQGTHYRRVLPRVEALTDFQLDDGLWEELHLPINLAFFVRSGEFKRVRAYFPSPAGATESLLTLDVWDQLVSVNPILATLEPDVEAWLANRLGQSNEHYLVSIDECYKLVGLIRTHWRGLSGGTSVWEAIGRFFASLKDESGSQGAMPYARP